MDSVSNVKSYYGSYSVGAVKANNKATQQQPCAVQNYASQPVFGNAQPAAPSLRTRMTKEEEQKYTKLAQFADKKTKKQLDTLLKNGILLNSKSNDNSTVLDNLYKIATEPRAQGLNPQFVLRDTVNALENPFSINQEFGNVPKNYQALIIQQEVQTAAAKNAPVSVEQAARDTNVTHSGDCPAASIEFDLAKKMPAEFSRFAQQLSSPKLSVEKVIQLKNLNDKPEDAKFLLDTFETPYTLSNDGTAKLTLAPDKNALLRARIQNDDKSYFERSLVDVLMQSTFMNVGSQQSYDSLTDIRQAKKFNNTDNKGLIEIEKTYTESVVEDKNIISVTYQIVDADTRITGYRTDFKTVKKQLLDSLAMGENVIIGYTQTDDNKKIINGHEITIIGVKKDKNNKLIFICNDTDDYKAHSIEYSEDYLIPKIHHAGLPQKIAEQYPQLLEE